MNDNKEPQQRAYVQISEDEYQHGQRALRILDLAVFLFKHAGHETIEAAGHNTTTFADLVEDQVTMAKGCLTPSPRK